MTPEEKAAILKFATQLWRLQCIQMETTKMLLPKTPDADRQKEFINQELLVFADALSNLARKMN